MASKAQAALAKIIAIISTVVTPQLASRADPDEPPPSRDRGLGLDLNLRLRSCPDDDDDEDFRSAKDGGGCGGVTCDDSAPAESAVVSSSEKKGSISLNESDAGDALTVEKSSEGECHPDEVEDETRQAMEGGGKEYSEITNIPVEPEEKPYRREGYLDLLLEAVRHVSAGVHTDEPDGKENETNKSSKRSEPCCTALELYEDCGPVVRSKRGRNQALPSRYRDSVLEPWRKIPTVTRCGRATKP